MINKRKALLLSAGYGRGHHSAAAALAEELQRRGWDTQILDACQAARPSLFRLTQMFYRFCVRHAPHLWGSVYRQLDSANWSRLIKLPAVAAGTRLLRRVLQTEEPDLVVCTYPLYAYMLDTLAAEGKLHAPYAIVVTDSLAISSPWLLSDAPLICLPDELSHELVSLSFSLPPERLVTTGFPVRAAFTPGERPTPGPRGEGLHIIYCANSADPRALTDAQAMLAEWPAMRLTLITERPTQQLLDLRRHYAGAQICQANQDMAELMRTAHLYIGKAGGASTYEAYSAEVPVLVNYILPGQEEGNLQLLQHDSAGFRATDTETLMHTLRDLLGNNAAGWQRACAAMHAARRSGGAARTADALERRFFAT
ncbi:MAG: hypothetical protein J1E42_08130 [Akkermansiaceae bacterium]|nr:hypothetical protein [Akkermansiaceae bacterium]